MSLAAAKDEPSVEPPQADCIREATLCRRQAEGVHRTTFVADKQVQPFVADSVYAKNSATLERRAGSSAIRS